MAGVSQFSIYYSDLSVDHTTVLAAYSDAESILVSNGVSPISYRELSYDGANITRRKDAAVMTGLSEKEQFRLYPQLIQLFIVAVNTKIYP